MDKKTFAIAIDGPLACGKGTLARRLANDLNAFYLYTGGMYRSVALYCLENGYNLQDGQAVIAVLPKIAITFQEEKVLLDGRDVTERISSPDVANGASVIAVLPTFREAMVAKQQELAREAMSMGKIVVAEGRDTGTKIFPDSPFKLYLTASEKIRAERRHSQYLKQGKTITFEEVLQETRERDKRDMERAADPLPGNPRELGYFILDNSHLSEEKTLQAVHEELQKRKLV
jgi:cytidylate kinase